MKAPKSDQEADRNGGASAEALEPSAPPKLPARRKRGCMGSLTALAGVALGVLYVANPGGGLIEFIPDVVPGFGNLDEAAATAMLVLGLQYLFGKDRED